MQSVFPLARAPLTDCAEMCRQQAGGPTSPDYYDVPQRANTRKQLVPQYAAASSNAQLDFDGNTGKVQPEALLPDVTVPNSIVRY